MAGQIKGSCWHPQTAPHLMLRWLPYFCRQAVRVRRSVNPAATQVGQNWGGSEVSSALGDIRLPLSLSISWRVAIHPNISPPPHALLVTQLLPVGRAGEAHRQSHRNAGGAKSGW